MTPTEALAEVRGLVGANRWRVSKHVRIERMPERGATDADIRHGLLTATAAAWQAGRGTWKLTSKDLDGDRLILVVAFAGDLLVVTIF